MLIGLHWYTGFNPQPVVRPEVLSILSRQQYAGECRWNYIADNEVDAGSSPAGSKKYGAVAQW